MAIRIPVLVRDTDERGCVLLFTWSGLLNGDTGDWIKFPAYGAKTFQAYGTFGAGGNIILEGSNDPTNPTNAAPLSDWQGNALNTVTAASFKTVREMPIWVRPRVSAGDGTTSLTVALAAHRQDIAVFGN